MNVLNKSKVQINNDQEELYYVDGLFIHIRLIPMFVLQFKHI